MMCQLEIVWRYCRKFNRTMVIDTRGSGMLDDLLGYYQIKPCRDVRMMGVSDTGWDIRCENNEILGRSGDGAPLFERQWFQPHGFDLTQDHPDQVLVHPKHGGGDLGIFFMQRLIPREFVKAHLRAAIAPLGGDYLGVHIRNTDYSTDYVSAFAAMAHKIPGRTVVVCSDDSRAIAYFQDTYGHQCTMRTTSDMSNTHGKPLHYDTSRIARHSNLAMLTDLYALAMGGRMCMVDTANTKRSGFAVLAAHVLRRVYPLDHDRAFELGPRPPNYLASVKAGIWTRVFRVRDVSRGGVTRHLCHPTYE